METKTSMEKLQEKSRQALEGGGAGRIKKQHESGKLTAREQDLTSRFDPGTFVGWTGSRPTAARISAWRGKDPRRRGGGRIRACQQPPDLCVCPGLHRFGGSLSLAHAEKICKVMETAMKVGAPIIGLCDSGGARIQEGVMSLAGYARYFPAEHYTPPAWFLRLPPSWAPAPVARFTLRPDGLDIHGSKCQQYVHYRTGRDPNTGEIVTKEDLGGAMTHNAVSGMAIASPDDAACLAKIREVLFEFLVFPLANLSNTS